MTQRGSPWWDFLVGSTAMDAGLLVKMNVHIAVLFCPGNKGK